MRRRRLFALLALLAAVAVPVAGQPQATPTPAASPRIRPLLPQEGLLQGHTWLAMGERLLAKTVDFLPALLAAILVFVLFLVASRLLVRLLGRMLRGPHVDPALAEVVVPLARYTVLAFGIIMALSQAGFQVASLLAGVGVAGLALGLAAQDTLGNLVAGFSLLWDRPFRLGDRVTIAGTYGSVVGIGLRSTRLRTLDRLDVILPNREVVNQIIVNHTLTPELRLAIPFGVPYREEIARVRAVVLRAVEGEPRVRREPAPEVVVTALGDSGVSLALRVWLADATTERGSLFALLELVKNALDAAAIETSAPQRVLQIDRESPPLRVEIAGGAAGAPAEDAAPGEGRG
jgi:small conductance mechanosensitive channel